MPSPTLECPQCHRRAPLVDSTVAYKGSDYGRLVYYCEDCDTSVGCHAGTTKPLGTMANAELRRLRVAVHNLFDPICKMVYESRRLKDPKCSKSKVRKDCYARLAERMGIPAEMCHIGNFGDDQCRRAIEILRAGMATKQKVKS
jgi:hypothetical protein